MCNATLCPPPVHILFLYTTVFRSCVFCNQIFAQSGERDGELDRRAGLSATRECQFMVNHKLALSSGAQPCSTIKLSVALAALSEDLITKDTRSEDGRVEKEYVDGWWAQCCVAHRSR